ncbi:unnamed protein product [Moneuplotes crassus]|uniref:Uncharacterized protein n=1 Tax=Euplotes crassus TaxID=5936 RepID=A0AAD1Y0B7_EUPCR|nr:unnamed protein product [Moneuplotes crassus]
MDRPFFLNGRFEIEPYTADTADCSFYEKKESLYEKSQHLGKMKRNAFDSAVCHLPGKLESGKGVNPALNNKFKSRLGIKPLKLNNSRYSNFQKQVSKKHRYEYQKAAFRMPRINPNRNSINLSAKEANRILQSSTKGFSTSRNRNKKLNKSCNGIPRSRDTLHLQHPNLNTICNSNDALELDSVKGSCNLSDCQTDQGCSHSKRGGNDNPAKLRKQINKLNQVIQKKDGQINYLKKTSKFPEVNELRQENQTLYEECTRLRTLCTQYMKKEIDSTELEGEVKKAVAGTIGTSTLQDRIKGKMSAINDILKSNELPQKPIEIKIPTVKFMDDFDKDQKDGTLIISNGNPKSGDKRTGYNPVGKKTLKTNRTVNLETDHINLNLDAYSEKSIRVDLSESSKSIQFGFKPNEDCEDEKGNPEVSQNEISNILGDLRFLLQVFGENAAKFLFQEKYLVSSEDAIQAFHQRLRISLEESTKLAFYLANSVQKENCDSTSSETLNANELQRKIEEIVGSYRIYGKEEERNLIDAFFTVENRKYTPRFLNEMVDLSYIEKVSIKDFENTLSRIPFNLNMKFLSIRLLRESNSLHLISGECIKIFVDLIKSKKIPIKTQIRSYDEFDEDSASMSTDSAKGIPNLNTEDKNFFERLADFLFKKEVTLDQVIRKKVYTKMVNGREQELINPRTFFHLLEKRGFTCSFNEKPEICSLLKNPHFTDALEVEKILQALKEQGVKKCRILTLSIN